MDDETFDVYLGFWTNWSQGKLSGLTLTLTRQNGGLIIAFLAIFVGVAGRSFWRISCLLLHRLLSTASAQDGPYHQRLAILRNSDTAEAGLTRLIEAAFAWRKHGVQSMKRFLPISTYALVTAACFTAAGLFSSRVTTDIVSEVILKGSSCAMMGLSGLSSGEDLAAYSSIWLPYNTQRVTASLNYASQCYRNTSSIEECHMYIQPQLPVNITRNASCPFATEMCRTQDANIIVDTGYIDSHAHLGINAPPKERFQLRSVYHCAPIVTEGFSEVYNSTIIRGMPLKRYYYGGMPGANFTYQVPTFAMSTLRYDDNTFWNTARPEYGIGVITEANTATVQWDAIPQLQRDDADVSIFFLSAPGILFTEQSTDLWFSATTPALNLTDNAGNSFPAFRMDEDASVLACARQFQFCNQNTPEGQKCQPLRGWLDNSARLEEISQDEQQMNRLQYIREIQIGNNDEVLSIVSSVGNAILRARDSLSTGTQGPLANNQWQLEVEHWVKGTLASLQRVFVEAARGPPTNELRERFSRPPATPEEEKMCHSQKIVSSRYSSFNVVGILIILTIGGLIIFFDYTLESVIDYLHERFRSGATNYASIEWKSTTTVQLQRLAHEGIGQGTWSKADRVIPVTRPGEKLGVLDIEDVVHPKLKASREAQGDTVQGLGSYDSLKMEEEDEYKSRVTFGTVRF